MKYALVGNNDGPLRILKGLPPHFEKPVCVGLQKSVSPKMRRHYVSLIQEKNFFTEFNEEQLQKKLENRKLDLIINCFCNFKFTFLLQKYSVLNVHLAPLPKYRGRHPLQWALINGEKEFGISIHKMTPEFDAGAIYWQKKVQIEKAISVQELRERLLNILQAEIGHFLKGFKQGDYKELPNNEEEATYVTKRIPEDSRLSEWQDSELIFRKIKALQSENYPAYLIFNDKKLIIKEVERAKSKFVGFKEPFISKKNENGIEVVCGDGKSLKLFGFNPHEFKIKINQKIQ